MAVIANLELRLLDHNHNNRTATVRVSYNVLLSPVERNMTGLRFKEVIQLWGADSPDPDDFLYQFSTQYFSIEMDGNVSRQRQVILGEEVLDEDGFPRPTDEVYAHVCVTPLLPTSDCKNSNQISHRF